jgi:drug/metabolite transporter (DMT)-like permease
VSRRAWLAFAAISVIWGVPYLFIKIAVDGGVTPLTLAWARVTMAAAVLLTLAWRAGTLPTLRGRGRWLLAYAIAEISLPFPLIAAGEVHVASSLAAIIIAAVPLVGALLALRFDATERPTAVRAFGRSGSRSDSAASCCSSGSTSRATRTSCSGRARSCLPRSATRSARC